VHISRSIGADGTQNYQYINTIRPEKLAVNYHISSNDKVWQAIKYNDKTPQQLYRKFKKIMRKRKEQYEMDNGFVDFENVRRSSRKKLKKKDRQTIQRIRQERKRILALLGKKDT
jgi:hypothetical protein